MAGKLSLGKVKSTLCNTLQAKNFVEIALTGSVSEIKAFLRFKQKFKMAAKSGGKVSLAKTRQ